MKIETTRYVAEFPQGFYTEKQPTYAWCFTRDLSRALLYATSQGASDRVLLGEQIGKYPKGKVAEIKVTRELLGYKKTLPKKMKKGFTDPNVQEVLKNLWTG